MDLVDDFNSWPLVDWLDFEQHCCDFSWGILGMKVPNIHLSKKTLPTHKGRGGWFIITLYIAIVRIATGLYTNLVSIIRQEAPESSR